MTLLYHIILFYKYNLLIEYDVLFDLNKNRFNYVSENTNCLTNSNTICNQLFVWYWLQIILILLYNLYWNTKVFFDYTIFSLWKTKY